MNDNNCSTSFDFRVIVKMTRERCTRLVLKFISFRAVNRSIHWVRTVGRNGTNRPKLIHARSDHGQHRVDLRCHCHGPWTSAAR